MVQRQIGIFRALFSISTMQERRPPAQRHEAGIKRGKKAAGMISAIVFEKLISFLMLAAAFLIVIRALGPSDYGIYTAAISVAGIFWSIGGLGVSTAVTKFIPEHLAKGDKRGLERTLSNGFTLLLVLGAALTVAAYATSGLFAGYMRNQSYAPIIALASLTVVLSMLFNFGASALIGMEDGVRFAVATISMTAVQSLVAVSLALLGFGPYAPLEAIIAAYATGFAASLYFIYAKGKLGVARPSLLGMKQIVSFSWPIGLSGVLNNIVSNLVPVALGAVAAASVLGNFGVISKISALTNIMIVSISVALIPVFAGSLAKGESRKQVGSYYSYSVHISLALLAPLFVGIIILAYPVAVTAFSATYAEAPLYTAVFVFGLLVGIFGTYAPQLLVGAGKVRAIIRYTLITTVIEIALIPVLIPLFDGVGAVVLLYLVSPLLTDIFFMHAVRKEFRIRLWTGKLTRTCIANAIIALLLLPDLAFLGGNYLSIIVAAAIILVAYPPILYAVRGIDKKDIRALNEMAGGTPFIGRIVGYLTAYASLAG